MKTLFICLLYLIVFSSCGEVLTFESYNIRTGKGMDDKVDIPRIASDILKQRPFFVGLQEVDNKTLRNPYDQAGMLGNLTNMHAFFGAAMWLLGPYGNAILSKLPILERRHVVFKTRTSWLAEWRSAIAIRTNFLGKTIWFATTHLDYRVNENQLKQCEEFLLFLHEILQDYPQSYLIITGDFNSLPDSAVIKRMKLDFLDVWDVCGKGDGFTFPSTKPTKRIDYIFVRHGTKVRDCKVECTLSSDHCQLIAHIEI